MKRILALKISLALCCLAFANIDVLAQPSNNDKANAIEFTNRNNWCSALAAYSNTDATADGWTSTCGTPNSNVWFKFQATTQYIDLRVHSGSSAGTIDDPGLVLWDNNGTEVSCNTGSDDVRITKFDLTIGHWYYLSVFSTSSSSLNREGTFTVCANDQIPFDYKAGALELTNRNNWCSALAAYSNNGATPDGSNSTCGAPNNNVWFKFQATTQYIDLKVNSGSSEGTISNPEMVLWDNNGAQAACAESSADLRIEKTDLTVGQWYYLSVYTSSSSQLSQGTFTLCANDQMPFDYRAGAVELTNRNNWCSALAAYNNVGATTDGSNSSCGTPYNNVWFKFQATTQYIDLKVNSGLSEGTISGPVIALWDNSGTPVSCADGSADLRIEKMDLTIGQWYYLSVSTSSSSSSNEGTFTLCANDQISFDFKAGAVELTNRNNWCSGLAAYSNVGANADGANSTCGTSNNNVWFKFQATTQYIDLKVNSGSAEGTITGPEMALWDNNGTQVACAEGNADLRIEQMNLTIGQWYYLSVYTSLSSASNEGTFTLCANDQTSFNYKAGAAELTNRNNWCSALAAYSNVGATADGASSTCGAPNNNVWFKFQATTQYINLKLNSGSSEGTISGPEMALWDNNGTQVACAEGNADLKIEKLDLTIGQWYYLSVYTSSSLTSNQGTFTMCVSDQIPFDLKAGAVLLTNKSNWCSADAAYTNTGSTVDGTASTCSGTLQGDVWFKFTANTAYIKLTAKTGSTLGTMTYPQIVLRNSTGTAIVCDQITGSGTVSVEKLDLQIGQDYYVTVANRTTGSQGSFTLCVNDQTPFNYIAGAVQLTDKNNWCSGDAAYSNAGSTVDGSSSTCTTSLGDVWFKFNAVTPYINLTLKTGSTLGTMTYPQIVLRSSTGTAIVCNQASGSGTVNIEKLDLTVGQDYYMTVSNWAGSQGSFTLCVNDQVPFNYKIGAIALTNKNNWCSADAAYTNVGSTVDGSPGTCATSQGDVWFKFNAATPYIALAVKTGSTLGTMTYPQIVLRSSSGAAIVCDQITASGTVSIEKVDLTIGQDYYITVSNWSGSKGSFTLCANDLTPFNYKAGAIVLTDKNNWRSANAAYSNTGSTVDGTASTCSTSKGDVWFKFVASTKYINLSLQTGSSLGTMTYPQLVLRNSAGTALACNQSTLSTGTAFIEKTDLTVGQEYYVSASNWNGSQGTFTLFVNDQAPFNYMAGALLLTEKNNWCYGTASYTNTGSTVDGTSSTCSVSKGDVWFKFTASTEFISLKVKTGFSQSTSFGTMSAPQVVLRDSTGAALACNESSSNPGTAGLDKLDLIIGAVYYVTVSNSSGSQGSFTLCVNDQIPFDYKQGAKNLNFTQQICFSSNAFTNVGAGADGPGTTCGNAYHDVWFKFISPSGDLKIEVTKFTTGGIENPRLSVWDSVGNLIVCKTGTTSVLSLEKEFIAGATYFISIDNNTAYSDPGAFGLCITDMCGGALTPVTPSVSGASCFENPTATITLPSTQSGITYYLNNESPLTSTGSQLKWDKVSAKPYAITAKRGNCNFVRLATVTVSAQPKITVFPLTVTGSGECGVDSIRLGGSQTGTLYQLKFQDGTIQGSKSGTGGPLYWSGLTKAGDYMVVPTNTTTNCKGFEQHITIDCGLTNVVIQDKLAVSTTRNTLANYTLKVEGKMLASGLNLKVPGQWPDYVFEERYQLPTISQLESYIKKFSHLPGIPSASEMTGNEVYNVSSMDTKLVTKIEELTLLMIHLEEQIDGPSTGAFQARATSNEANAISSKERNDEESWKALLSKGEVTGEVSTLSSATVSGTLAVGTSYVPEGYAVAVKGNVIAKGINIKPGIKWPDYVFATDYDRLKLGELENFISENGHLPNMLSAKKMRENGVYSLSEMDVKLLEKIEELTLYVIDLHHQLENTKSFVKAESESTLILSGTTKAYAAIPHSDNAEQTASANRTAALGGVTTTQFTNLNITGTLAIGCTTVPQKYKVAVAEDIIAETFDVIVPEKWPDYVFEKQYKLTPLSEVRTFIQSHGHLPGFKSAEEMYAQQHYDVVDMDVKILEKIEELTLHMISLSKKQGK